MTPQSNEHGPDERGSEEHPPEEHPPENRLFERWCRRGDPAALEALFDATAPQLLKLAIHLVGDACEAEDLVQATFLAALEQRTSVDPTRPVMPWLTSVLAHKAQQHRRRAARVPDATRLELRVVEDPSRPLERRELDGEVARALDALDEPYRAVLVLRLRHGLEIPDIAHVLERDPGTVRVQLHRGLEKLRATLPERLVSSLMVGWLAPRGLAAVRALVVQHAAPAAVVAGSSLVIGGWIVSKKVLVAAAALLALVALVWLRSSSGDDPGARAETESARVAARPPTAPASPSDADGTGARAAGAALHEREPAAPSGMPLRGRVVDAEAHEPIAGAELRLFAPREALAIDLVREQPELYELGARGELHAHTQADWPLLIERSARARFGGEPLSVYGRPLAREEPTASARSTSDGSFSLPFATDGGVLEGASTGYATRWRAVRTNTDLVLELWPERELRGVVIGADGQPVTEPLDVALMGVQFPAPPQDTESTDENDSRPSAPHVIRAQDIAGLGSWTARTDAAGRFQCRVGAASVSATILTPGWGMTLSQYHEVGEGELVIRAVRVPMLHFFDAASGAPIERVRLLGRELANRYVRWSGEFFAPRGLLQLPGDAFYVLSHEKDNLGFVAWSEGYAEARVALTGLKSTGTIEVPMSAGAVETLAGRVLRDGAPLAGAEVALIGRSPSQWRIDEEFLVDAATTSADGSFRFGAASGSYLVRVRTDDAPFVEEIPVPPTGGYTCAIAGHEPYFQQVDLPAQSELTIELARSGQVEVEIVDGAGSPQVRHVVSLSGKDGRQLALFTDEHGLTRFANLPAGSYTVYTPRLSAPGAWNGGEQREVTLAAAGVERVRIELQTSTGPRHARVVARGVSDYSGWKARPEFESFDELAPDGTLSMDLDTLVNGLEVLAPDARRWHVEIPKDARDGFVLELEAGAGIYRGRLEHEDGTPWTGVAVHATAQALRTRVSAVTDDAGAFELPGLANVEYRLLFNTEVERSAWDDSGNALAGVSFQPSAPPSETGTWLAIRVAARAPLVRLHGVVEHSGGAPLVDATLVFACDVPETDGTLRMGGKQAFIHTDERGAFELQLPRTPRLGVSVYATWTRDGLVLTQELALASDDETVRLIVP